MARIYTSGGNGGPLARRPSQQAQIAQQTQQQQAQFDSMMGKQKSFMDNLQGKLIEGDDGLVKSIGGVNQYGQKRADFIQMRGADGELNSKFKQTLGSAGQNLLDQGMSQGDSPWATAQRQMIGNQQNQAMGNAAQQNAQQQAQARGMAGMRGGVGSGALQNIQNMGNRNLMGAQQGIGAQANNANLQTSTQDQGMKNQILGNMAGMQQNIQLGNIQRLGADVLNQNKFNQGMYKEDMAAYGAIQSANAQSAANSDGK